MATAVKDYLTEVIDTILEKVAEDYVIWLELMDEIKALTADATCMGANQDFADTYLHDRHPTLLLDSKSSIRGLIEETERLGFPRHGLTAMIPIIKRVTKAIHDRVLEDDDVCQAVVQEANA
ncbi:hypothetical protein BGZ58_000433 [Dissophora ornata]|nr:hypothetical protein BGZ58_000433 [Dissophora ornata]